MTTLYDWLDAYRKQLERMRGFCGVIADQEEEIVVGWESSDGYYEQVGGDLRKLAQEELERINALLNNEEPHHDERR